MAVIGLPVTRAEVTAYLSEALDLEPAHVPPPSLDTVVDRLADLELRQGEVVLVRAANGVPLLTYFFAVLFAGGVPALLAPNTPVSRIRELAEKIGAGLLLTQRGATALDHTAERHIGSAVVVRLAGIEPRFHEAGDVIILTSGTSGVSSGCCHRLSALLRNGRRHALAVGLREYDNVLVSLPLNYSYALVAQALAGLTAGARLVITGPPFTVSAYSRMLLEHQVTSSSLTPFMVRQLINGDWKPPEPLRALTVGGAAMEPSMTEALLDRAPGLELYLTYGLTEAGPRVSTLAAHLEPVRRLTSVGQPLIGTEVSLRDVDSDGVGELLVRSDTVMRYRVGMTESGDTKGFTGEGQIATGDLFSLDDEGYLYCHGRRTEFLTSRGSKVSLPSVRRIADTVPGVVNSVTRPYVDDDGETVFQLDLYVMDTSAEQDTRRALLSQLLPVERPSRIRLLPASELGHK
jgi:acyl-CoA synthetase (AMP-forming)/AMP-acid ligase II